MSQDLRFDRALRRRSPLPMLATFGLALLLAVGFLADVGRGRQARQADHAAQVT